MKMIDFHSHILPNVDDGSKSVEETFELLEEAKNAGFEGVISTSHYMEEYYEVNVAERKVWINALAENLYKKNINLKLYLGNEIYFTENLINLLETGKATSINNSNYVLFEFPLNSNPMNMYDIIYDMLEYKLIPVLAHPERYSFVQKEPEIVYDLIQKGVLMQSNYGSILGRYGEKAELISRKLLENNMVHFLGSDVHKPNTIYPRIGEALDIIKEIVGREKLEELTTINPKLVLENRRIDIDEPREFKLSLKEKMIVNLKK
jgi:protein-tyrosine phosphatase